MRPSKGVGNVNLLARVTTFYLFIKKLICIDYNEITENG
jgi:hypothetical protein